MYPIANSWKTLARVTVTTTAAQLVTAADLDAATGGVPRRVRWICYYADGDVYWGGPANTDSTNGIPLPAGTEKDFEATSGLGVHFATASGTATVRVVVGFDA